MSTQRVLVVVLVLFLLVFLMNMMTQKPEVSGGPAPDVQLVLEPKGDITQLTSLHGTVVILDFWATWCGPCKIAMPQLEKIYQKYKDKRVLVVGVSVDNKDGQTRIPAVQQALGITFPIMIAEKAPSIVERYDASNLPTIYVIDKKGNIRKVERGVDRTHGLEALDDLVGDLVKE